MNTHECSLDTIHLVLADKVWKTLALYNKKFPRWPVGPATLTSDLQSFERGVPTLAQIGQKRHEGQQQLLLCTPVYTLLAVPPHRDQTSYYFVPSMRPTDPTLHDQLADGALLLKPKTWYVHTKYAEVPPDANNNLDFIWETWQQFQAECEATQPPQYTLTTTHESYLNTIDRLIEVTRELMMDKAALAPPIGYRTVKAVAEMRLSRRDIYHFQLVSGHPQVKIGDFLRLRDVPDLRGRVTSVDNGWLMLKFEGPVDWGRIPEQGIFEQTQSDKPFRLQKKAVDILRTGQSKNSNLLRVLVDDTYQGFTPASVDPLEPLNLAQKNAFQRALTIPDMLLVLGPPGTGKTRSIAQIARQFGQEQRRVLITAKTHQAVDNVLQKILEQSTELLLIRIGHEDKVSGISQDLLIDTQARMLQARILDKTESYAQMLTNLVRHHNDIDRYIERLKNLVDDLQQKERNLRTAQRRLKAVDKNIHSRHKKEEVSLQTSLNQQRQHLQKLDTKLENLAKKLVTAKGRQNNSLLGWFWTWRANRLKIYTDRLKNERNQAKDKYETSIKDYDRLQDKREGEFETPEYNKLKEMVAQAEQLHQACSETIFDRLTQLDRSLVGIEDRPKFESVTSELVLNYLVWLQKMQPNFEPRHKILTEWRTRLEARTEELYPALIRFADVVGATCIGIATDQNFRDVDFDLVIADEAGQIALSDLLVPLVRADAALLVGDHLQLPPFVDSEVQAWLEQINPELLPDQAWLDEEGTEAETIASLMTKSAFELLFSKSDPEHIVRLVEQYRMPQAVADFSSIHFYEGKLLTKTADKVYRVPHHDPLFTKPLIFIDTSDLPRNQRKEASPGRNKSDPESWGMSGYLNRLEARLIADIVEIYHQEHLDWVVIVPYRAQAGIIRDMLKKRLPAAPELNLNELVATVDSFQGGERSRVIYGFTRSNEHGQIGFMKELRRLNVAITRAQDQLVLVGDMETLTQAKNRGFRKLVQALLGHVSRTGELISYKDHQELLHLRRVRA